MYSKEMSFDIRYCDIDLTCDCQVSAIHYDKYTTSTEDVIESLVTVYHNGEAITDLLSSEKLDDIWNLCYEAYYA